MGKRPRDEVSGFPVVLREWSAGASLAVSKIPESRQVFPDEPHAHSFDPIKGNVMGTQAQLHGSSIFPTTPSI